MNPQNAHNLVEDHPQPETALPARCNGLLEMFEQACRQSPHKTAIEYRGRQLTYSEVNERSSRLANALIEMRLGNGSNIGVMLDDRIDTILALIAIFRAGSVFVPLDETLPPERLSRILNDVAPARMLISSETAPLCAQAGISASQMLTLSELDACSDSSRAPDVKIDPDAMRYICYTSGSTGAPKGIAGRLKALSHFIEWEIETFRITEDCRVTQFSQPAFDPFFRDVFVPLCAGGTLCIPPQTPALLDSETLLKWIDSERITLIHCVPSLFASIVRQRPDAERFSALKHVLMAGETLPVSIARRWIGTFGKRTTLVNLYGATETTMVKFSHIISEADLDRGFIPIGQPINGARALIIDEGLNVCPLGIAGEIIIRTPYRSLGYYKNSEATRQVFVPNPFSNDPADLVYRTGDLGRVLSNGDFQLLGRRDQQVKIRGMRVELSEIESALLECPHVSSAAVIARDEDDGEKRLIAYVVPTERARVPEFRELRAFLRRRLPESMVPALWVVLAKIPLTPNGKLDRAALPAPDRSTVENRFVEPATPAEMEMSRIWAEVLGLEKVGTADNFFDLGGHSLLATQVVSRIRKHFNADLPVRALFEYPTVAELAMETIRLQAQAAQGEDLSQMLSELSALSDDEITARLSGSGAK